MGSFCSTASKVERKEQIKVRDKWLGIFLGMQK